MPELLLIRHGETAWNAAEVFRGRQDIPLNETGLAQAARLGEHLAEAPISAVLASPLSRAFVTAEHVARPHGLSVDVAPDLIDMDFGSWQGLSRDGVRQQFPRLYDNWLENPQDVQIPDGESLAEVSQRAYPVLETAMGVSGGTVALVTHRVVLKVLILALLGVGISRFWSIRLDTCGVTSFHHDGRRFVMTGHNDTSFLSGLAGGLADF